MFVSVLVPEVSNIKVVAVQDHRPCSHGVEPGGGCPPVRGGTGYYPGNFFSKTEMSIDAFYRIQMYRESKVAKRLRTVFQV